MDRLALISADALSTLDALALRPPFAALSATQLAVCSKLLTALRHGDDVHVAQAELAKRARCSVRAVGDALAVLVKGGLVARRYARRDVKTPAYYSFGRVTVRTLAAIAHAHAVVAEVAERANARGADASGTACPRPPRAPARGAPSQISDQKILRSPLPPAPEGGDLKQRLEQVNAERFAEAVAVAEHYAATFAEGGASAPTREKHARIIRDLFFDGLSSEHLRDAIDGAKHDPYWREPKDFAAFFRSPDRIDRLARAGRELREARERNARRSPAARPIRKVAAPTPAELAARAAGAAMLAGAVGAAPRTPAKSESQKRGPTPSRPLAPSAQPNVEQPIVERRETGT